MELLKPIRTEADYRAALAQVELLFDLPEEPNPDSEEGAYFVSVQASRLELSLGL